MENEASCWLLNGRWPSSASSASSASSCCSSSGGRLSSSAVFADDSVITRELNELSFSEREKAMDDLHGVSKVEEETPQFVEERIAAMNKALDEIPLRRKRDYTRALFLRPGLKDDTKFKLRFLRADCYDALKAATRLTKYYAEKRKLFGEEKLVKTITADDFGEKELLEYSDAAAPLPLPIKDQSGRPIFLQNERPLDTWIVDDLDSVMRPPWYNMMTLFDNETAQLKGAVLVIHVCLGPGDILHPTWVKGQLQLHARAEDLLASIPGRFTSIHFCINSPSLGVLVSSGRLMMGKTGRQRLRVHIGSDIENEYNLMTFGIPIEGVLQKTRGTNNELHMNFLNRRRAIDRMNTANEFQESVRTGFVPFPNQSDVLFGRGRPYRDFPGNRAWNQVLDDHYDRYRLGNSKFEKTCVTMEVVKKVQNSSEIRFCLESIDGGWRIIRNDMCLRAKVAVALQNRGKTLGRTGSREMSDQHQNKSKRRRYEAPSKIFENDGSDDPFEPLPL